MKSSYQLVVVIPIGPGCLPAFIEDTISSVKFYVQSTYRIILADDSQKDTGRLVQINHPEVDVLVTPKPMGKRCGLYVTLSLAFSYALEKYHFKALLRMDTDALLIGNAPEKNAFKLFESNPTIGMAGQYPLDFNGMPWDKSWPDNQIRRITQTPYFFKNPLAHLVLLRYYRRARKNNYSRGESVFGGACFFSEGCLMSLRDNGLLPKYAFKTIHLEEDHLFSLLAKSIGYELGSLSGDGLPFACSWRGLPASPETLQKLGKKIIHSVRSWNQLKEEGVRNWFKERRHPQVKASSSAMS